MYVECEFYISSDTAKKWGLVGSPAQTHLETGGAMLRLVAALLSRSGDVYVLAMCILTSELVTERQASQATGYGILASQAHNSMKTDSACEMVKRSRFLRIRWDCWESCQAERVLFHSTLLPVWHVNFQFNGNTSNNLQLALLRKKAMR